MSPDGTLIGPPPPAPSLVDALGVAWSIRSDGYALRNGKATTGHATQILLDAGDVLVKSPTAGIWWEWHAGSVWKSTGIADMAMMIRARRERGIGTVPTAPSFSVAPAIIGTPQVGVASAYTPGTSAGVPTPTRTQQWTLDAVDISGATGATYTPVSGDATHALRVREIETNASGSANSTSVPATVSAAAVAPSFSVAPAIIGTPTVGVASSYTLGTVSGSPAPTITQQWTLDGADISGATGTTYTPISGDATHLLRVREIATNASGSANSTSAPGTVAAAAAGGTFTQFGASTLSAHLTVVRTALAEGLTAANARMLPASGVMAFSGAVIWRDKYAVPIGGGHGDSHDDGGYALDLATGAWETMKLPSTFGSSSDSTDSFGEYVGGTSGRPASQHNVFHNVVVGNDVIQTCAYAAGNGAASNKQAHRWNFATGLWERYGTGGTHFSTGIRSAFYHEDTNRIARIPLLGVGGIYEWIPANDATAAWTTITPATLPPLTSDLYGSIGFHPPLNCYVWIDQHDVPTRDKVYVLDRDNIAGGWVECTLSGGITPPQPMVNPGLEYCPPLNCFVAADTPSPDTLYYLAPTGAMTAPWRWTSEVFTGGTTAGAWAVGGVASSSYSRIRWSAFLNALVMLKDTGQPIEVFTPAVVAAAAADWSARKAEAGVVVAYDFAAPPANGGTVEWGSLKNSPHVTCFQQNESSYGAYVNVDKAMAPPGSTAAMRWDVVDCPTSGIAERADLWWISIDDYADQFGDNAEFWVQWRTCMDKTYAQFQFLDHGSGGGGTDGVPLSITSPKHLMIGEGMQTGELGMNPAWPYGYRGGGTSQTNNQIAGIRVDFEGETNLKETPAGNLANYGSGSYLTHYGYKYPNSYHGKPGYVGLDTRGTDSSWFTNRNAGVETTGTQAACEYQIGTGYRDISTCFIYPTGRWFTMMVHIKLGVRGHGLSSLVFGYRNVPATRLASNQISLPGDTYTEHFRDTNSAGCYIRILGTATGSVDALVTLKDTSSGHAVLTLSGMTGTIQNEALTVDEYETGFVNSTIEYWGAQPGGSMVLLHKRSGVVMRTGNYANDATGYSPTAKYGTFAWTTFMTNKSYQQTHPQARVWVSQIVIKSGATAPSTPGY